MLLKILNRKKFCTIKNDLIKIKLIICDVDGVLTDGKLTYDTNEGISRNFDVKDGLGIKIIQDLGIKFSIISGGKGSSILSRAKDLKIEEVFIEVKDKREKILYLKEKFKFSKNEILFVGDDLNDLVVKNLVGIFCCPKDSYSFVKKKADFISSKKGGNGVIREIVDLIIKSKRSLPESKKIDEWVGTN